MIERGVHPIVPLQGSLGASGDLAPLAHIALVMIGLGEAEFGGKRMPGGDALAQAGLAPIELAAKEGLALTNGTALMAALGCLAVVEAENAAAVADIAGALSLEALHGTLWAFDARICTPFDRIPRQADCAACMRRLLEGSTFARPADDPDLQDAYTLRCIPQVHGACHDAIKYTRWVVEIELNSATDNPLDLLGGGAAHRDQRRQLPRRAAGDRVRLPGAGHDRAGQHRRAPADPADGRLQQPPRSARFPDPGTAASIPASC